MMQAQLQTEDKTNGRWTKQEHQNFILGLQMFGKNWKKIEELIGTRNGSQIRSHAQKFFLKFKGNAHADSNTDPCEATVRDPQTVNSKTSDEIENQKKYSNYSYFLGKIVEYSESKSSFDFWQTLIDCQQTNISQETEQKRKDSFVECDQENLSLKQRAQPQKKIKI